MIQAERTKIRSLKIAVYTAVFGDKDQTPELLNKDAVSQHDISYFCITDNPNLKSGDYEVIAVKPEFDDPAKNARKVKLHGVGDMSVYDVAIWHDSSMQLYCDKVDELASMADQHMVSAFHHVRYCAYLEAVACIDNKKDNPLKILRQMASYYFQKLPASNKLHETGILVIKPLKFYGSDLQKIWWNEIKTRTRRDQISLPYARMKSGTEVGLLAHWKVSGHRNPFSKWIGHVKSDSEMQTGLNLFYSRPVRVLCKKLIYEMRRRR